jgi:hypothetical protein
MIMIIITTIIILIIIKIIAMNMILIMRASLIHLEKKLK